jgi:UDP-N-acetylglucosamine 1-carboxyvinyltransferase
MEDAFIIRGGKKLEGEVILSGAKNAALKLIIATLLFENQKIVLENVPQIADVLELIHLINLLGGKAKFIDKNVLEIDSSTLKTNKVDMFHGSKIRVSFMLFAPLLYKFGECFIPNPGGCRIGARPIDRIIEGMKAIGIEVGYSSKTGFYHALLKKRPTGFYQFKKPSHTGTELLIMLSVFAKDKVILQNCALEPEIDNLIDFLNQSGAKIKRDKNQIEIEGVKQLTFKNSFKVISDRNEAVTFISLAMASFGKIKVAPIREEDIFSFHQKLKEIGISVIKDGEDSFVYHPHGPFFKSTNIETSPHPGFMTDWQPNWAVLMTQAKGKSMIIERVFENRFAYVEQLKKLGAKIDFIDFFVDNPQDFYFFNYDKDKNYQQAILIDGPTKLHNGVVDITDLRAGATLAMAALLADDESVVNGASILKRGYENFVEKVRLLGGEIKEVT